MPAFVTYQPRHRARTSPVSVPINMNSSKQRITWIDIGKGLGIVLVTFGHIRNGNGQSVWLPALDGPITLIYLFHMPLFFFLGGLTFSSSRTFPDFLKAKMRTLLIPYYVFSLYFLAKPIAALIMPDLISQMQANKNYGIGIGMQFYDILINGNGLWFLWAFFIGELISYPFNHILHDTYQYVMMGFALIATSLVFSACFPHIVLPFRIVSGVEVSGFILLGIACKHVLLTMQRQTALLLFLILAISLVFVSISGNFAISLVLKKICDVVAMFAGVAACTFLAIAIMNSKILEHIGRFSLSFYVVNALTLNIGKILFFKILHINGAHATQALQWVYGILLTIFSLSLLWIEDLLIRKFIPWSVGIKKEKQLSSESDTL